MRNQEAIKGSSRTSGIPEGLETVSRYRIRSVSDPGYPYQVRLQDFYHDTSISVVVRVFSFTRRQDPKKCQPETAKEGKTMTGTYSYNERKEINEAIYAGERALDSLRAAKDKIDSARRWGVMDLFGGNMISGFIKHSRMSDARHYLDLAKRDLDSFSRELADVQDLKGLDIRIGDFLTFADFFFDGFLADLFVQSRIGDARRSLEDAIRRVENVVAGLKARARM